MASMLGLSETRGRCSPSRQNALAVPLKEYGAVRRIIYAAKYLPDPAYRRKIAWRRPEQQNEQAWCLTVVTNAVVCRHTEYMGLAVGVHLAAVNYYASITVDYCRRRHAPAQRRFGL
ncbi:hypothetical protein [Streptomyces sp. NPDC029674]|uniref:hypothetical protein n=1 Tax=Streptomyces sp. NPDC029674 TaxID=3365297 RepID=UPI00384D284F